MQLCIVEEGEMCGFEEFYFDQTSYFSSLMCNSKSGWLFSIDISEFLKK